MLICPGASGISLNMQVTKDKNRVSPFQAHRAFRDGVCEKENLPLANGSIEMDVKTKSKQGQSMSYLMLLSLMIDTFQ